MDRIETIDLEDGFINLAGHHTYIDLRVTGTYVPACKPYYRHGVQVEPEEPSLFTILSIKFRPTACDLATCRHLPTGDWADYPTAMLLPGHAAAIIKRCCEHCDEMASERVAA